MMQKIFILISFFLLSCTDNKPKEVLTEKEEVQIVEKEITSNQTSKVKSDISTKLFSGSISDLTQEIEKSIKKFGYNRQSKFSLEQYKRKQFKGSGFKNVFYEIQYSKPMNKNLSIIVYEYDKMETAIECYNSIESSKYLDGIFKSGGFLLHHLNYVIQVASTCSMSKTELEEIRDDLSLSGTYLFCYCGGKCIERN